MSPAPTLSLWFQLFGSLALETTLIFLVATGLQRCAKSGAWRRTIWQVAFVGLGLITLLELTGISRAGIRLATVHHRVAKAIGPVPPPIFTAVEPERVTAAGADPVALNKASGSAFSVSASEQNVPQPPSLVASAPPVPRSASSPPQEARGKFPWWPGIVWLAGFAFLVTRAGSAHLFFKLFRRHKQAPGDAILFDQVQTLARPLGIRRTVCVTFMENLPGPVAFGITRPTIALPEGFTVQFTSEQQKAMLLHELAHLASHDPLWYPLASLVAALLWWQPLAWLALRQFRAASEAAADEATLLLENGPGTLAECLVALGQRLTPPRSSGWLGIEGNGFRSGLGRRVERLLQLDGRAWRSVNCLSGRVARIAGPVVLVGIAIAGAALALPREEGRDAKNISQTWERSVAGLAIDAVRSSNKNAPESPSNSALGISTNDIPGLIADAKRFIEADKLDQAEGLLDEVLKLAPESTSANYYWKVVQEKREARKELLAFEHGNAGTPLSRFQKISPTNREGVTNSANRSSTELLAGAPAQGVTNSAHPGESAAMHTRTFKIDLPNLLHSLQGVTVGGAPATNGWRAGFVRKDADPTVALGVLLSFFEVIGVDLSPPKGTYYNARSGMLMVRASLDDLELIEQAIQVLGTPPPQVMIEARFCEIDEDAGSIAGVEWIQALLSSTNSESRLLGEELLRGSMSPTNRAGLGGADKALRSTNSAIETSTTILDAAQYRRVLTALEERPGVQLLTAPKVTTLSGRQANMKAVDVKYIVTDLNVTTTNQGAAGGGISTVVQPITEPVELGPVLDVVPYVCADGYTIQMTIIPSLKEFVGYDSDPLHGDVWATGGPYATAPSPPKPTFKLHQMVASAVVQDGQTLVLEGGSLRLPDRTKGKVPFLGDLPFLGRLFQTAPVKAERKKLLIFVTPTMIDAAGNRVHPTEGVLSKTNGASAQAAERGPDSDR